MRLRALSTTLFAVLLLAIQMGEVSAATYDRIWSIIQSGDPQKRHFAELRVGYSHLDSVRTGRPLDVSVSIEYLKNQNAYMNWIEVYDVSVRLRISPGGGNLASSSRDATRLRLVAGQQFSSKLSVISPSNTGQYLVVITWTTFGPATTGPDGLSIREGRIDWDTGEDSDPEKIPKVAVQRKTEATLVVQLQNLKEATIKIDGQSIMAQNFVAKTNFPVDTSHTIEIPKQVEVAAGTRAIFDKWSDGDTSNTKRVILADDLELVAVYKLQYLLSINSDQGNPQGRGWYDSGTQATYSVTAITGFLIVYTFDHWEGDATHSSPSGTIVMSSPKTIVARWRADYTQLLIVVGFVGVVGIGGAIAASRSRKRRPPPTPPVVPVGPTQEQVFTPEPPAVQPTPTEYKPTGYKAPKMLKPEPAKPAVLPPLVEPVKREVSEVQEYEDKMAKLEELWSKGRVDERVYQRLRAEYQQKLSDARKSIQKTCAKCGTAVSPGNAFCPSCGAKI